MKIDRSADDRTKNRVLLGFTLLVLLLGIAIGLAGCTHIPEHCRDWANPKQCAIDHPEGEFFCDDTPERDPERCGLTPDEA